MKKYFLRITVVILMLLTIVTIPKNGTLVSAAATKGNNYPIVMVHGLFGWGNNELAGEYYWGGSESLRQWLTNQGYTVYTPTIGPISSNWDRACELYAYIKGGTVDYGLAHSQKYGHARYGRTYSGIYPQFGEQSTSGTISKINLIGHSMGGQTIRTLVELLESGSTEEIAATPKDDINPLFTGGKHWVNSVTTIATPHNGSQESHVQYDLEPLSNQTFAALAAVTGGASNSGLDLQMDQWGLKRTAGESYLSYYKRVMNSNIWGKSKDLSVWDLSPEGAEDLNSWVSAQKDIYYFSIGCLDTHKDILTGFQVPNSNMNAALWRTSIFMGMYTNNQSGEVPINSSWWENDGIVSLVSATSPSVGSNDQMVSYSGTAQKGKWNYLGTIDNIDHLEVVQMKYNRQYLQSQYLKLVQLISSLSE